MYYYRMMDAGDGGYGLIMMLLWALFIAVIIFLVVRLLRMTRPDVAHKPKPLDIAKARYAKGELDKNEFEQIKKDLAD